MTDNHQRKLEAVTAALDACKEMAEACPPIDDPDNVYDTVVEYVRQREPRLQEFPSVEQLLVLLLCDLLGYPVRDQSGHLER